MTTTTIEVLPAQPLTWTDIRDMAERAGAYFKIYDDRGYADINSLVTELGGTIERSERTEFLIIYSPKSFRIFVQGTQSDRRRRFAVAQALAVYLLEYDVDYQTGSKLFVRGDNGILITRANVFAATLLMPEEQFTAGWAEFNGDDWKLSERFGVSPQAAAIRGQTLGLVGLDYSI
jgi:Zn-dependent peptidase ImmA (M78 family)